MKKNQKYTEQQRKNLSIAMKNADHSWKLGLKFSKERIENIRKSKIGLVGEKSGNWKGGISSGENVRDSVKIRTWRSQIFHRDNYTCQVCFQYGGILHADHIKPFSTYISLRYDINNGRTLCRACHYYVTFKRKMPIESKWGLVKLNKKECS